MKCAFCEKEFELPKYRPNQKYCSHRCSALAVLHPELKGKIQHVVDAAPIQKTLDQWAREADECNLDYGTYRGLIEQGHSFDELKAQNRPPRLHARRTTHHSFSTGDLI